MSFEEACRIINHSRHWLCNTDGDHVDALLAVRATLKNWDESSIHIAISLAFAVGRAYGVRGERARRHKA